MSLRAENFGLDIRTIRGPETIDDLSEAEKQGHTIAQFNADKLLAKSPVELLVAAKKFKELAEMAELEVDDSYSHWYIRQPLTERELYQRLAKSKLEWEDGLRQYLWIAADISNKQDSDAQWKPEGRKARAFQDISRRLGYEVTPFWDFEYTVLVMWEKDGYSEKLMNLANFTTAGTKVIEA